MPVWNLLVAQTWGNGARATGGNGIVRQAFHACLRRGGSLIAAHDWHPGLDSYYHSACFRAGDEISRERTFPCTIAPPASSGGKLPGGMQWDRRWTAAPPSMSAASTGPGLSKPAVCRRRRECKMRRHRGHKSGRGLRVNPPQKPRPGRLESLP